MKKNLALLILGISFFAISAKAQSNWEKIYAKNNLIVEIKTVDCNPNNNLIPNTYGVLRFTNLSNEQLDFDFEILTWYNNTLQNNEPIDAGDPSQIKTVSINPNSSVTGDCNSKKGYLKVFYKHNNPKMDIRLTKIEIEAK